MGKYFTVPELCKSETAVKLGIDNKCNMGQMNNMLELIKNVLDPLREAFGKPIIVTSGFRSERLNKAVGGSKTSHHTKGMAADIVAQDRRENRRLFTLAQELSLPFCQLIWEKGDNQSPAWVHISYDANNIKRQVLRL